MSNADDLAMDRKLYYDLMPTDELEAILQATVEEEEIESVCSMDTLLLITEVLAKRRGSTNMTIDAALRYRKETSM